MPDTGVPWSLPFPTIGDAANGPDQIGAIAVAADAALDTVNAKTVPSSVLANTAAFDPLTGWSLSLATLFSVGQIWFFRVLVTRTGAAIAVPASGDLAANVDVAQLTPSLAPLTGFPCSTLGGGRVAVGAMVASGKVILSAVGGSGAVATGDQIDLAGVFVA